MAGQKLAVTITANIDALKAALALGQQELIKTAAGAQALSGSLNGQKLEQSALQMAVAIKATGGAVTLTAAEAKRADAAFTAWFEKAAKRGAEIPADLKKVADETKAVAKATEDVAKATGEANTAHKGWFATIAGGTAVGTLIAEGLAKAGEIAIDVFKEVAHWLTEITLQGSKELGIEKAFNRLTGQVGMDAKKLLKDLQTGTHGTIEEMELMIRVNENLAAGMNLTTDQYKTLAAGAFALSKATGKDVKESLDKMNDAMLTGRTRAVAMLTGKIDLAQAEADFAKKLGVTADQLTSEGKIEAAREVIVKKVGEAVDRLGVQTDGLGTKVKQAQVAWKDFQDELGKVIAGSPVLMTLVTNIGEALSKAFGVGKEEAVKRLGMAVDQLAISAVGLAVAVAPVVGAIGTEFNAIQVLFRNVMQVVDLTLLGVKTLALAGLEAADAVTPGGAFIAQQQRLRSEMGRLVIAIDERKAALAEDKKAEDEWWNLGERMQAQLRQLQAKMEESRRTFKDHKDASTEHGAAVDSDTEALKKNTAAFVDNGKAAEEHAKKVKSAVEAGRELATAFQQMFARGASGDEMFKALGGGAAGLQKTFDELAMEVPADFKWIVDAFRDMGQQIERDKTIKTAMENLTAANRSALEKMVADTQALAGKQREALNKAFTGNLDVQIKAAGDMEKFEQDSLAKRLRLVHTDMEARRNALNENSSNYAAALKTVDQLEEAAAQEATRSWQEHVQDVEQSVQGYGDIFGKALAGVPDIIAQALTGGGGIGNAVGAIFSKLTGDIGAKLFSGSSGLGQSLAQGAVNLFGGNIGGKIAGALPAIGSAFGGIVNAMTQSTNRAVSTLGQAGSWAMQGAAIGSIIPGIGTAVGAAVGAIAGAVKGLLNNAGKKTNDLRDEYIKSMGGFDKLAEAARKAGVELNSASTFQTAKTEEQFKKAAAELDAKLKKYAEDRAKLMQEVMAGERLATKALLDEMEAAVKGSGEAAKEAKAYFAATLKTAAAGLTQMFAGLEAASTKADERMLAAKKKALETATGAQKDALQKEVEMLERAAKEGLHVYIGSQAQAEGLAGAIAGTFAKMRENGATFREALAAIKGPLDALRKQLELTGYTGGGAFENLSRLGQMASDEVTGPLMDAIDGANQALIGLANSGLMNQDTFAAMAVTATNAYQQIIAQGVDGQTALQMMQPTLQTIWEMQQQFGYAVDDTTQAMIDEAVAAGTVGTAHMSAAERTAKSMERVAVVMEAVARKMGVDLPEAAEAGARRINDAFSQVDPTVPPPWNDWGAPPELTFEYSYEQVGEGPPGTGGMASGGVVYAAGGWTTKGSDIVPAMLTPGERVLTVGQNYDYENRMRTGGASASPVNVNVTIQALDPVGLKQVVEREVVPLLVSAYRRNVNGARTDTRKELVE